MSDLEEEKQKFEIAKLKVGSQTVATLDIGSLKIERISIKDWHDVDKHLFEAFKVIERY